MKDFGIIPPGGVAINQWKDGSIHFRISAAQVEPLKAVLEKLIDELQQFAIFSLETEKQTMLTQVKLPPTRVEQLEAEIARLKEEAKPKTIVTMTPDYD